MYICNVYATSVGIRKREGIYSIIIVYSHFSPRSINCLQTLGGRTFSIRLTCGSRYFFFLAAIADGHATRSDSRNVVVVAADVFMILIFMRWSDLAYYCSFICSWIRHASAISFTPFINYTPWGEVRLLLKGEIHSQGIIFKRNRFIVLVNVCPSIERYS